MVASVLLLAMSLCIWLVLCSYAVVAVVQSCKWQRCLVALQGTQAGDSRGFEETSCQTACEPAPPTVIVVNTHAGPLCDTQDIEFPEPPRQHKPAFRPAGQLKHVNPRPKSAPPVRTVSTAARRRAAGLRECGCPKPVQGLAEEQRAARRAAELEAQREECTVIVTSPRPSSTAARPGCCHAAAELTAARAAATAARAVAVVSSLGHDGGASGETEVTVVTSPRARHGPSKVVVVTSPRCKNAAAVAADAAPGKEVIVVQHDPATAPRTTGSYPRSPSPRPMERSQGCWREGVTAGCSSSEACLDEEASLEAGGLAAEKQVTSTTTVRITIPPGAQGTNFTMSANVGSPARGTLGASMHVSPLQSSKHAGELQVCHVCRYS